MPAAARKTVTVLFCDLADSTSLGESMDPEALRALLGRYYEAMRAAAERHGGTVEKYIGDAVMAVFGIPVTHEDDALRAVRAALEMRDAARTLGLTSRIGIDTGEVVAGDPAAGHAFATGAAVVTAERLEKQAGGDGVLISAATHELVRNAATAGEVAPLELKGIERPVRAWRLHALEPETPGLARRLDSPLVGRREELALLRAELERTQAESQCRLVSILGPAGAGKTRLVLEFAAEGQSRARFLTGRCLHYGDGATYRPIVDIVREAAALADGDSAEEVRAKIGELLHGRDEDGAVCRTVAALVGAGETDAPPEQTFWAIRRVLETIARKRPLVVVLEDVEWAEPTLLDLIDYLVGWSHEQPILLCCLARTELLDQRPSWRTPHPETSALVLGPLRDDESLELLGSLAGDAELDALVAERIAAAAAGNPLFAEELLRMLVDDGALRREGGRWVAATDLNALRVPGSVRAVLAARLDRLAAPERAAIQRAAVLGNEFWWDAVATLAPEERDSLASSLQTLVRKQLVLPTRSTLAGADAFRFGHPLIRDVAYEALPKAARAELHERAARWLDERGLDDETVGRHLERAFRYREEIGERRPELAAQAAVRLGRAGRSALEKGDAPAAASLLERALGLLTADAHDRGEVALALAAAFRETGKLDDAARVLAQLLDAGPDPRVAALARLESGWVQVYTDPASGMAQVDAAARSAIDLFEELDDHAGLAKAWWALATTLWVHCRSAETVQALERALAHARTAAARTGTIVIALAHAAVDGPVPVDEALERCARLQTETGDPAAQAVVQFATGYLEAMRGDGEEGRRLVEEAIEVLEDRGQTLLLAVVRGRAGEVELLLGAPDRAEQRLRSATELLESIGENAIRSGASALLGEALCALGRADDAEAAAELSERLTSPDDVASAIGWRVARARLRGAKGALDEAEELARAAVALAEETDYLNLRGGAQLVLAEVLASAGGAEAAAEAAGSAVREYERKGNVTAGKRAREVVSALALTASPAE